MSLSPSSLSLSSSEQSMLRWCSSTQMRLVVRMPFGRRRPWRSTSRSPRLYVGHVGSSEKANVCRAVRACVSQSLIGLREPRPPRPRFELLPLLVSAGLFVGEVDGVVVPRVLGFKLEGFVSPGSTGATASSSGLAATSASSASSDARSARSARSSAAIV